MQIINQAGNVNQKSRIRKELQDYSLRIHHLRSQSKKVLNRLQSSAEKKRANHIGAAALLNSDKRSRDE